MARIVCAQDMGIVVNPTGATMQIEGALTMGLGYALSEELRFRGGEILDRNFDTYALPRFSDVPTIESVLVRNDEGAPQRGCTLLPRRSPALRTTPRRGNQRAWPPSGVAAASSSTAFCTAR